MPTHGLCKSSRSQALSVRLPWRAVLLSAPSKHCARRRFAHTRQKPRGQRAGSPPPALSPPNAPAGRTVQLSKRSARCVGRESNAGQLLGRQLCSPLYHQRYTALVPPFAGPGLAPEYSPRRRRLRIPAPTPRQSPGGSVPSPSPPAALRRHVRASATQLPGSTGPPAPGRRFQGFAALALRSPPRQAHASALSPGRQRGARSFQHPAIQSPSPPGAWRSHFPRRLGDTGPSCLHASRRCAEPHGGGVSSLGAH